MANTTTHGKGVIHLVLDGSTDWSYITDAGFTSGVGLKISSIQFNPSAANDILIIRDRTVATGAIIFNSGPAGGTAPIYDPLDPPQWQMPVIGATDLTLSTPANASVIIRYV